jgi:hypothetical protein
MPGGRKITDMLIGETMEWSVVKGCLQRGILLPLICYLVVSEVKKGLDANGRFTLGVQAILSVENSRILSQSFLRQY